MLPTQLRNHSSSNPKKELTPAHLLLPVMSMNDNEPEPSPSDEPRDFGKAANDLVVDAGAELAGGVTHIFFGLACIAIGFAAFIGIGEAVDFWSPALGLAALGAVALLGKRFWDPP